MSIDEQVISLELDTHGALMESIKLAAAMEAMKQSGQKAATDGLGNLEKAAKKTEEQFQKTNKSTVNAGYAVMEFGRVFQDVAQGGIGGGLNNIERVVQFLGGGTGLAGVFTAVGVAAFLAKPHIEAFMTSLGLFGQGVQAVTKDLDGLKARIKELEDKKIKIPVEILELEQAKKDVEDIQTALKAIDAIKKLRGGYEKESGQQVEGMIAEAPGGGTGVAADLRKQAEAEELAANKELAEQAKKIVDLKKQSADLDKAITASGDPEVREALRNQQSIIANQQGKAEVEQNRLWVEAQTRIDKRVGNLIDQATKGQGREQINAQDDLAGLLRRAGRKSLAAGVAASSPQELEQQDQVDSDLEKSIDQQKRGVAKRKEQREAGESIQRGMDQVDAEVKAKAERDLKEGIALGRRVANGKPDDVNVGLKQAQADRAEVETRAGVLAAQGVDAMTATQQAAAELLARQNGQEAALRQLRMQADWLISQARQASRQFQNAAMNQSALNSGNPQ